MDDNNDLEKALTPKPRKKSPAGRVFLVLAALALMAAGYWLAQQFLAKGEVEIPLPEEVARNINQTLRLDDGRIGPVRITTGDQPGPAAAPGSEQPGAAPGSPLPEVEDGRPAVSGIIVAPELSAIGLVDEPQSPGEARQRIYSGSDAVVTLDFVNDLAEYLAANYWPKGTHLSAQEDDASSASLSSAGQRYGAELTGLAAARTGRRDYLRERALVLHYVYTPPMLDALTRLYADRFADALAAAGFRQKRSGAAMNAEQTAGMLLFYARCARAVAGGLEAYSNTEDAPKIMSRYTAAREAAYLSGMSFHEAGYRVENARELRNEAELSAAGRVMKSAEQEYRKAMLEEERVKETVLAFMGKGVSRLEDQDLLYIAAWASRRGPGARPAHLAAAAAAGYLAQALDEKAAELRQE